jgi:hypothetical protein
MGKKSFLSAADALQDPHGFQVIRVSLAHFEIKNIFFCYEKRHSFVEKKIL